MTPPSTLWTRNDAELNELIGSYFGQIADEDLRHISEAHRRETVGAHVELAEARSGREPVIAVQQTGQRSVVQVVTDDMPYLVDSVTAEITRAGHGIALVIHPIFLVTRNPEGPCLQTVTSLPSQMSSFSSGDTQTLPALAALVDQNTRMEVESWITVELDRSIDAEDAQELVDGLYRVLGDVSASNQDQQRMIAQANAAASEIRQLISIEDRDETAELLEWMGRGNFVFLGCREYQLAPSSNSAEPELEPVAGTGLGILADDADGTPLPTATTILSGPGALARRSKAVVITKANSRSTVRRRSYMDYVAVRSFDAQGVVIGERRFLGLFSQSAYTQSITTIPLLRSRSKQLLARSGFRADSHSGKDLLQILETYPRNELLQMDLPEMEEVAQQILQLQERRRIKLFLREDHYGRFMTALVYLPRDRYNTAVRHRLEQVLVDNLGAESVDFTVSLTESVLARLFFRLRVDSEQASGSVTTAELEERLARAVRSWSEGFLQESYDAYPQTHAEAVANDWAEAFPADYRVIYEVTDALHDAAECQTLQADQSPGPRLYFYAPETAGQADMRMKLYLREPKTLTDTLPTIDDFGLEVLDERSYVLTPESGETFYLYDLGLRYPAGVDQHASIDVLKEAALQVLTGRAESDVFSQLVLQLRMGIDRVTVLRAYAKYMRQLGIPYSYDFLAEALLAHPQVTGALISYFTAKFDPELGDTAIAQSESANTGDQAQLEAEVATEEAEHTGAVTTRDQAVQACRASVVEALSSVATLDADRVLSTFLNLIDATDRTNVYQEREWVSLKLRPESIDLAPKPRPAHEIWVYSPTVEGTHLRFDKVARGGLRWSDRQEDFRTEVLGLVKAQMVKNAVIVPSGAKGGFYAKALPDPAEDRSAWFEAGRQAYQIFIRGLLDLTDHREQIRDNDGELTVRVTPPDAVVAHDGEDSYLVVAADKGTATFSDTANEISQEYGHWLGDAFASGGSVGYDHKAMGITARGAWESVKAHFAGLGVDTQSQDFTVVGIGDMGGDVFGNGMLLSEHIRLVAAFNHLHIFIDPDPDADASFQERKRLFTNRPSGWDSYDPSLISTGGGVFSRQARSIEITEQMRSRFGLADNVKSLTPPELISAVLKAPVDLLYNGGIGTYVKGTEETHEEVGDRANNGIRVNGNQLRASVVAEGGNLGLTQAGRIEAAQQGVLINTDAIDNSAGVDSSDYEVNIKILLDQLIRHDRLEVAERSWLLQEMTDEVAQLVLQTNKDQNVLLLADRQRLGDWSPSFGRLITWLENKAGLDRELEVLPTDEKMHQRINDGVAPLTSPELSVLSAYAKIQLKGALAGSDLLADPWLGQVLQQYFPQRISQHYGDQLAQHPLAAEIISNLVANAAINMGGSTFIFRALEETYADEDQVVRAFLIARELFRLEDFDAAMRQLPVSFPSQMRASMYVDMRRLLDRAVRWIVNHTDSQRPLADEIEGFRGHMEPLVGSLGSRLRGEDAQRVSDQRQRAVEAGMGATLAAATAELFEEFSLLDIATLADSLERDSSEVADVYFAVYAQFEADMLLNLISTLPRQDKWQALARAAQRDELYFALREITRAVLSGAEPGQDAEEALAQWTRQRAGSLERTQRLLGEMQEREHNIASLTVLLRQLRTLIGA